jgi:L-asparaginase II
MSTQPFPLIEVTRGNIIESVHYGSLAAVKPDGTTLIDLGDTRSSVFLRSAAKPFQALAFLEQGGAEEYDLQPCEVAILCASHSGTEEHIMVLQSLHKKIGITEDMLQCGVHSPFDQASAEKVIREGKPLRPFHHDCSGKHTGMLAFAKMLNASLESYLDPDHPVQKRMLQTFADMCRVPITDVELGTDGCSAPVFAVPLMAAALGYARLCHPDELETDRALACSRITASMVGCPTMVGGPDRFDSELMAAAGGILVSKMGAEGYQAIGILPGQNQWTKSGLGITIKISDGDPSLRAAGIVALTILQVLGVLTPDAISRLARFDHHSLINARGMSIGEIRPSHSLIQALEHFSL